MTRGSRANFCDKILYLLRLFLLPFPKKSPPLSRFEGEADKELRPNLSNEGVSAETRLCLKAKLIMVLQHEALAMHDIAARA